MKKKYFVALIVTLLTKSIISEKYLTLHLEFYKSANVVKTTFSDKTVFLISFSHSKLIYKESANLQNINITDDDSYPSRQTKHGLLGTKYFQINNIVNLSFNYVYNNESNYNYLGFSRGVEYDNKEILKKYNLDFVSQLIEKKIIDKYYIYLPAFFDDKGEVLPNLYLTLGMIPDILDNYLNQTSYAPLNTKYPKKWSVNISHIIYEDASDIDNPLKKKYTINTDVIFTNSGFQGIIVPSKYRDIFDDIFISHFQCKISFEKYRCNSNKVSNFKLFFVFNGFSHLISNELITDLIFKDEIEFYFHFRDDVNFFGIDTFAFGNYHFLFDGEKNFIRFMNKKEGMISDVSDTCGYENRDGIPSKYYDIQYLLEWEERLKNDSKKINETLIEVEKMKTDLEICKSDVLKQEIDNLRKDLDTKEKDISKNKSLMILLIVQIILTVITIVIIILCFFRVKRSQNNIENCKASLVDKSIN